MDNQTFLELLQRDIIEPGTDALMKSRYFSELRDGTLSIKRLQGFALQHYLHNIAVCKGFALCMVKNAHLPDLYNHFAYQFIEEKDHPDLAKGFGFALGLKEEDFHDALPVFECAAHTGAVLRGMLLASPAENRASALVNETMVCRYSEEFNIYLEKNYGLADDAREFFVVHSQADIEHTALAAQVITRYCATAREQTLVQESARNMIRFKIAKFAGIYEAYS